MAENQKPLTLDELNERVRSSVGSNLNKWNEDYTRSIMKIKGARPDLPPQIFDDMIEARKANLPELVDKIATLSRYREETVGGVVMQSQLDGKFLERESANLYAEFSGKVFEEVKGKNIARGVDKELSDSQVKAAFLDVNKDNGSLLKQAFKGVYDEDKGGAQWGGLLGGIGGLLLGMSIGGGFEGGLMGIITAVVVAMIGVWAGNKLSETFFPAKASSVEPSVEKGLERKREGEAQGQQQEKAQDKTPAGIPITIDGKEIKPDGDVKVFSVNKAGESVALDKVGEGDMVVTVDSKGKVTNFAVANKDGKLEYPNLKEIKLEKEVVFGKDDIQFGGSKKVATISEDAKQKLGGLRDEWTKALLEKGTSMSQPQPQGANVKIDQIAVARNIPSVPQAAQNTIG